MAHPHVMGPYKGPGEQKTVETLCQQLPDDWDVVAGCSLPGTRDDLDLVVIAKGTVFLLEEKAWGPHVKVGHFSWVTSHRSYPSPLDRVAHLSRVLASMFRSRVRGYGAEVGRRHAVVPGVVLSHDGVQLAFDDDFDSREVVVPLRGGGAAQELVRMADSDEHNAFSSEVRSGLLSFLTGLESRNALPGQIREFKVDSELARLGFARCFLATTIDGTAYVLRCVPAHGWGHGVDISEVAIREAKALGRLDQHQRAARCLPPFRDEERQWIVTPIEVPRETRSLLSSVRSNDPKRDNGRVPDDLAQRIVGDAFSGLASIHQEDLVHRGLAPHRVLLGRGLRVRFADFFMAHIGTQHSIGAWLGELDQDASIRFRAPECQGDPRVASAASDVYSLAYCLGLWLLGRFDAPVDDLKDQLITFGDTGRVLIDCLNSSAPERPTAVSAAERLTVLRPQIVEPMPPEEAAPPAVAEGFVWTERELLAGRYELRRKLGSGGFATTWLAFDHNVDQERAIKAFRSEEASRTAKSEFGAMSQLTHERCARTWDVQTAPDGTVFLVNEYVEGVNLEDYVAASDPDADALRVIALDVLEALQYLHSKRFLHRDISPRNIIVSSTGQAKLIDFGLCSPMGGATLAGTPAYMAPELFQGTPPNERSDVYSVATTFLFCMLGRLPYRLAGAEDRAMRTLDPLTDAERRQWGRLGHSLLEVFMKAAHLDPNERTATAAHLAEFLRTALEVEISGGEANTNPTVESLRQGYRGSKGGNAANRGLDNDFLRNTYVPTLLDSRLLPDLLSRKLRAVFLTGNPGDGKTAFLVKVREELVADGGLLVTEDDAGWTVRLGNHTFVAVYDASESNNQLSSDDLLHEALTPPKGETEEQRTVMLAINDGRLLQFFTDYEHVYEDHARAMRAHFSRSPAPLADIAVVDLKERSLTSLAIPTGLASAVALRFTDPDRWSECETCLSRTVCPMLLNAQSLRGDAQHGFAELILVSHLRRQRRATFRDLRSALGWLITGDLRCDDVHRAREQNIDLSKSQRHQLANLAFDPESADYLVREWTLLDPAAISAPAVARSEAFLGGRTATTESLGNLQRRIFLGLERDDQLQPQQVRAYTHFVEFCRMLESPDNDALRKLLLGISRIVGASGFSGDGLAIAGGERGEMWAVLKTLPAEQFRLSSPSPSQPFVEAVPDRVTLRHRDGAKLDLSLDTAELILRAADGEILDDIHSDVVRQEIEGFTAQLVTQPTDQVLIIDEVGRTVSATRTGLNIELVEL